MEQQRSDLEQRCLDKGLRMTGQRRTILSILSQATDHPDVEQVHQRALEKDPGIGIATVYRTLRLLEDRDILESRVFKDKRLRYEDAAARPHDHLIDIETGRVIEFQDASLNALKEEIAKRLGYRLVDYRLELYGTPSKREVTHEVPQPSSCVLSSKQKN